MPSGNNYCLSLQIDRHLLMLGVNGGSIGDSLYLSLRKNNWQNALTLTIALKDDPEAGCNYGANSLFRQRPNCVDSTVFNKLLHQG